MATKFLDYFGKIPYDFTGDNGFALMTNFTKQIKISDLGETSIYVKYRIQDGERPDTVSTKLYGTPNYYWMLFLINDSLKNGISGWPLSDTEFDNMIANEYDPYMFLSGNLLEHADGHSENNNGLDHPHYSTLPLFTKYFNDIEVYLKDGNQFVKTNIKIVNNDYKRFGLILTQPDSFIHTTLLGLNEPNSIKKIYFKPKFETVINASGQSISVMTPLAQEWLNLVQASDNTMWESFTDENGNATYLVHLEYLTKYSFDKLQNATYQYFRVNSDGEEFTITHFDALKNNLDLSSRITFIEYETILNNRKKNILAPNESAIAKIEKEYFRLISL